jgi:hypothetical protein
MRRVLRLPGLARRFRVNVGSCVPVSRETEGEKAVSQGRRTVMMPRSAKNPKYRRPLCRRARQCVRNKGRHKRRLLFGGHPEQRRRNPELEGVLMGARPLARKRLFDAEGREVAKADLPARGIW